MKDIFKRWGPQEPHVSQRELELSVKRVHTKQAVPAVKKTLDEKAAAAEDKAEEAKRKHIEMAEMYAAAKAEVSDAIDQTFDDPEKEVASMSKEGPLIPDLAHKGIPDNMANGLLARAVAGHLATRLKRQMTVVDRLMAEFKPANHTMGNVSQVENATKVEPMTIAVKRKNEGILQTKQLSVDQIMTA